MRVLICEDEPVTAARIERLSRAETGVTKVFVSDTGGAAQQMLEQGGIDIALLDINLPDMSGFDVAEAAANAGCHVIFVTAYDEHAIQAFALGAVDYLLKPVKRERFSEAMARAQEQTSLVRKAQRAEELGQVLERLRDKRGEGSYIHDFWIKERDRRVRVPIEHVRFMEAARDYVILHTADRKYMIRRTMADVERQLDPSVMLRIHRSYFVNLREIQSVVAVDGRPSAVAIASGDEVPIGPAYQSALKLAMRRLPG